MSLVAEGGFVVPTYLPERVAVRLADALPTFRVVRGGIDFSSPEVRWARQRERELRASAKMWDWPRPPE